MEEKKAHKQWSAPVTVYLYETRDSHNYNSVQPGSRINKVQTHTLCLITLT